MKKIIVYILVFTLMMGVMPVTSFANDTNYSIRNTFNYLTNNNNNDRESLIDKVKTELDKGEYYFKQKIKKFSDMGTHWSDITVGKLVELGVISGYTDGTFKPNDTITRAEFTTIVRKSLDLEKAEGNSFQDTTNHWAKQEIHTLVVNGGIDKNEYGVEFDPNKNITRLEMAKIIVRSLGLTEQAKAKAGVKTQFADDNLIPSLDKGYIIIASDNNIISGYPDKTFKPNGQATRAEASQMIVNMLDAISNLDGGNKTGNTVERINDTLKERDFEVKLPNGTESVAKNPNPETYEELIENIETLRVYPFSTSPKNDWELIAVSQFISNTNSYESFTNGVIGAIRMEFPSTKTELSTLNFNGEIYQTLHADELIKQGFSTGLLIKDGEVLWQMPRIGVFSERTRTRPYYSLGVQGNEFIYKADYIAFSRFSEDTFTNSSKYNHGKGNIVLYVFENPYKR